MALLIAAIVVTMLTSFFCSLCEAIVLSTTVAEIEGLKKSHPRRGQLFDTIKHELDKSISAILTLNTIANTLGSVIIGGLATNLYGDKAIGVISAVMTIGILVFSEVLPKNIGVVYRRQ